jgi:hypothetical protein
MSAADPVKTAAAAATPIDSTTAANAVIGTAIGVKAVATTAAASREVYCSKIWVTKCLCIWVIVTIYKSKYGYL